jgi:hypothetical protein
MLTGYLRGVIGPAKATQLERVSEWMCVRILAFNGICLTRDRGYVGDTKTGHPLLQDCRRRNHRVLTMGQGFPLLIPPQLVTHLEADLIEGPLAQVYEALSQHLTVIRLDKRGTGLSERDASDYSSDESFVPDIEAVVDALSLPKFAMYGFPPEADWLCTIMLCEASRSREPFDFLRYDGKRSRRGAQENPRYPARSDSC